MASTTRFAIVAVLGAALLLAGSARSEPAAPALQLRGGLLDAVRSIANPAVAVRCTDPVQGQFEELGRVDRGRDLIELAPSICRRANTLAAGPARPYSQASYLQAQALLVVVHESVHLSPYEGATDEALTECRALQLVRAAARAISVEDATARALGHEALHYDAQLPGPGNWMVGLHEIPSYRSPDCYDGGPLDIHPRSRDWPN